jgi:hypothetical protein
MMILPGCLAHLAAEEDQPLGGFLQLCAALRRMHAMATARDFRRLALSLPEATEGTHGGHPDFRVGNKVFASLGMPDESWGTVKLTPEQQEMLIEAEGDSCKPAAGAWGRRGYTHVRLASVDTTTLRSALNLAWRNTAPKRLLAEFD